MNKSPWLEQLNKIRKSDTLKSKKQTDISIIGAGIAGVSTAYYVLKHTNKNVILLDAYKVAHGATGHNGGFLATYFERTFSSLVKEFGLKKATEGQKAIESSWQLLEDIILEAGIQTPMWQFTGYAGCTNIDEVISHLRNNALRNKAGLSTPLVLISSEAKDLNSIPKIYRNLYSVIDKKDVLKLLETNDEEYIAVLEQKKGCMNSALFCEELTGFMLKKYSGRFNLYEHTKVRRVVLKNDHVVLDISNKAQITSKKTVLCTNGFENITLINQTGKEINTKFHAQVRGIVGYMAGYLEKAGKPPIEISYLPKGLNTKDDVYTEKPYFYLTRRPYELEEKIKDNLICIGGPEKLMDDTSKYLPEHPYPEEAKKEIDNFLKQTYKHGPRSPKYKFLWHGIMGFTRNNIRLIGPEPLNPMLLYNLGCNGVGLLPSIYGGYKIAQILNGEKLKSSIFDPK